MLEAAQNRPARRALRPSASRWRPQTSYRIVADYATLGLSPVHHPMALLRALLPQLYNGARAGIRQPGTACRSTQIC